MAFRWPITKAYLDMAKEKFRSVAEHGMYPAMSMHPRQEIDLKIGVAFSRHMTKAYLYLT